MNMDLSGVGVALVTPLNDDFSIDFPSLEKVVNHVIDGGVDYLVVLGTTGESPVFSWSEKLEILEFIIQVNENRVPIVFGLGGNNTFDLIEKSKDLAEYNLAAILSASPYYNKPSQEGIINHYQMLADAFPHPIILYNVPARTASNMEAATTLKLAEHPNIIGMKEASGDMKQCQSIQDNRPTGFALLSGDDAMTYELLKMGADGVISVIGNLLPKPFSQLVHSELNGDSTNAKKLDNKLQTAYNLSMQEGNPSSIKSGLEAAGLSKRTVKPPLFDGSDHLIESWEELLKK